MEAKKPSNLLAKLPLVLWRFLGGGLVPAWCFAAPVMYPNTSATPSSLSSSSVAPAFPRRPFTVLVLFSASDMYTWLPRLMRTVLLAWPVFFPPLAVSATTNDCRSWMLPTRRKSSEICSCCFWKSTRTHLPVPCEPLPKVSGSKKLSSSVLRKCHPPQSTPDRSIASGPHSDLVGSMNWRTTKSDLHRLRKTSTPCIGFGILPCASFTRL
mmetsp:Transcript_38980/g.91977  ORF Transcript_38980/g.91977 Transcript_38980/m.91977 type:complete len:211 (+) Transcript_38980:153-785(+)